MKTAYRLFLVLVFSVYFIGRFGGTIKRELGLVRVSITLTDFENALESNGITYSDKTPYKPLQIPMMKAVDGASYIIDGYGIKVCQFDLRNVQSRLGHSRMANLDFDGVNYLANKNLILVPYEEHPEWDKILKVFNSL